MQLEQRRQAMLQLLLSNQNLYYLKGVTYIRGLTVITAMGEACDMPIA